MDTASGDGCAVAGLSTGLEQEPIHAANGILMYFRNFFTGASYPISFTKTKLKRKCLGQGNKNESM